MTESIMSRNFVHHGNGGSEYTEAMLAVQRARSSMATRQLSILATGRALVDALPIFGSGTVLVPWGIWALLSGDLPRGFGLLFLYGLVTLVRSLLEPRLVSRRAGLPPLVALISMYGGFRLFGCGRTQKFALRLPRARLSERLSPFKMRRTRQVGLPRGGSRAQPL